MRAYGLIKAVDGQETWLSETVAILFEMYEEIRPKLGLFFCITASNLRFFIQKIRIFDADRTILSIFQIFS